MDGASIDLVETEDSFVHARIKAGRHVVELAASVSLVGKTLVLRRVDVQGAGADTVGAAELRRIVMLAKELLGVDELRIEGATRTSGASPGRRPRPLTF